MKLITFILLIFLSTFFSVSSNIKDCSKYDKLSTEYAKCTSEIVKEKSIEIKNNTVSKLAKTEEAPAEEAKAEEAPAAKKKE